MSTFPKNMLVWSSNADKKERVVLCIRNKKAIAVVGDDEQKYHRDCIFECATWAHYEDIPTNRPMTRKEMLGFLANTPGLVTRTLNSEWHLPQCYGYELIGINHYQWATIDADGNIGEPQEFEK